MTTTRLMMMMMRTWKNKFSSASAIITNKLSLSFPAHKTHSTTVIPPTSHLSMLLALPLLRLLELIKNLLLIYLIPGTSSEHDNSVRSSAMRILHAHSHRWVKMTTNSMKKDKAQQEEQTKEWAICTVSICRWWVTNQGGFFKWKINYQAHTLVMIFLTFFKVFLIYLIWD